MQGIEDKIKDIRGKTIEVLGSYSMDEAQKTLIEISDIENVSEVVKNSSYREELDVYSSLLKFIIFQTLPENTQLKLFESSLVRAFKVGVDIKNRLSIKMNLTPDVLWPETLQSFLESMLRNEERIGKENIVINGENNESPPFLSNWLRDYNRIYGMDSHEKIIPHKYIAENRNVASLDKSDKFLLLKLLEFYEELKFPSQEQIKKSLERVLEQYPDEYSDLDDKIIDQEEELVSEVKGEIFSFNNNIVKDKINSILTKFPKTGEQIIGKNNIKLIYNGEIVSPTINNWLADYRAYAGAGPHEINERSDYLMRSPNVQDLHPKEREQLALLLRSFDEEYLLEYSTQKQEIIF